MRTAIFFAVLINLAGCAQMRQQFREHPVRSVVLVGGAVVVGGLAARSDHGNGSTFVIVTTPGPDCSKVSCR